VRSPKACACHAGGTSSTHKSHPPLVGSTDICPQGVDILVQPEEGKYPAQVITVTIRWILEMII